MYTILRVHSQGFGRLLFIWLLLMWVFLQSDAKVLKTRILISDPPFKLQLTY